MFILEEISCGGNLITMDRIIPDMTSLVVTLIKIGIPVLLIIFGMLDLGKAVMAQKEDEIKKSQQMFLKRILSAALVFFVVVIVQLVFNLVAKNQTNVWDCVSCFVNGVAEDHKANSCR
jgi:uncharacterized membrane protein YidH (DUF202 family)